MVTLDYINNQNLKHGERVFVETHEGIFGVYDFVNARAIPGECDVIDLSEPGLTHTSIPFALYDFNDVHRQRQLPGRTSSQMMGYAAELQHMEPVCVKLWHSSEGTGRFYGFDAHGVKIKYELLLVPHAYHELQVLEPVFFRRVGGRTTIFDAPIVDAGFEVE